MNIKMLKASVVGLVLSVSGFANAGLITLNFDEEVVPFDFKLDGTSYFDSFGVKFEDSVNHISHALFAEDGVGIYNYANYFITIIWDNEISSLDFNWAVFQGDIIVTMYDVDDNLLGTSSYLSAATNGVGTISSARIRKVTWFGTPNAMGLDSLTWTTTDVPEPSTLAIFALSIMGLASRRFKKQ